MAEDDAHRPFQFSLRSLFVFTTVACVVMSIWGVQGAVLMLLVAMQIVAMLCVEADRSINRDVVGKPLLSCAAFLSLLFLGLTFVPTAIMLVKMLNSLWGTVP